MTKINHIAFLFILFFVFCNANAEKRLDAYELIYEEQETGTDTYQVKFTVNDSFLRIDQAGDTSGYVIYDDNKQVIYSVSHQDESVLVIPKYEYKKPDLSKTVNIEYYILPDAPKIAGQSTYNFRVTSSDNSKDKCMDILLAEGLLTDVAAIFSSYQRLLTGQQSRLLNATPVEYQNNCFLSDQVYNEGDYYQKGLPIQEWHSNGKTRLLLSYKKVKVGAEIFQPEESYQKYSLDGLTKGD